MSMRDVNTDNGKHGPPRTKAEASSPAFWPLSMGAWDAPAFKMWTDDDPNDGDGDESYESEKTGAYADNPISVYKPSDLDSTGK